MADKILGQTGALISDRVQDSVETNTTIIYPGDIFNIPGSIKCASLHQEESLGGWRPVTDTAALNIYVVCNPFKIETPTSILAATQHVLASAVTSPDLTDM